MASHVKYVGVSASRTRLQRSARGAQNRKIEKQKLSKIKKIFFFLFISTQQSMRKVSHARAQRIFAKDLPAGILQNTNDP